MKKLILGFSVAAMALSCQKLPEGGNHGALKLEEGTERYSDDVPGHSEHAAGHKEAAEKHEAVKTDSTAAKPADSAKTEH